MGGDIIVYPASVTRTADLFRLRPGAMIGRGELAGLIVESKRPGADMERIDNTPHQGINPMGGDSDHLRPDFFSGVILKAYRKERYEDGWTDQKRGTYRYFLRKDKGESRVNTSSFVNRAVLEQPDHGYPLILLIEDPERDGWLFSGYFDVDRVHPDGNGFPESVLLVRRRRDRIEEGAERPLPTTDATRVILDTNAISEVKALYNNKCQVCGRALDIDGHGYSEGHHLRPLGTGHGGKDLRGNVIVLCPNHHAEFDLCSMAIDPHNGRIVHVCDRNEYVGARPVKNPSHDLDDDAIEYHFGRYLRGKARTESA